MNKQILRNKYKQIRKNIKNKEKLDSIIYNKIISSKEYKESNLILTYVSLKEEVDTIKLIKHSLNIGKQVAVPKCIGNLIEFYYINTVEDISNGTFNILEPITDKKVIDYDDSICIVPGIAFDKENNRIGYGRGFYDRFLENYNGIKIGLTYKECICDKIDADENDIKMDKVIF